MTNPPGHYGKNLASAVNIAHIDWLVSRTFVDNCSTKCSKERVIDEIPKDFKIICQKVLKKHVCNLCNSYYNLRPDLVKRHKSTCSEKCDISDINYLCEICQKGFKSKFNLNRHKTTIHGGQKIIIEKEKYMCCAIEYSTRTNLLKHYRLKHKGKKFHCQNCGKKINSKESMKYHQKHNCC